MSANGCVDEMDLAFLPKDESNCSAFEILLELLKANVETFFVGEFVLPVPESESLTNCLIPGCSGKLQLLSKEVLMRMRNRAIDDICEPKILNCVVCNRKFAAGECNRAALDRGFQRCFGRDSYSKEEVQLLIWKGLPVKPFEGESLACERWLLLVASIQNEVNTHDWKHRQSCFKNGRSQCRYKIPHVPCEKTSVEAEYASVFNAETGKFFPVDRKTNEIVGVSIQLQKRCCSVFATNCNSIVMSVLHCNNCTNYVENQKVSLYYGAYAAKYCSENQNVWTK